MSFREKDSLIKRYSFFFFVPSWKVKAIDKLTFIMYLKSKKRKEKKKNYHLPKTTFNYGWVLIWCPKRKPITSLILWQTLEENSVPLHLTKRKRYSLHAIKLIITIDYDYFYSYYWGKKKTLGWNRRRLSCFIALCYLTTRR